MKHWLVASAIAVASLHTSAAHAEAPAADEGPVNAHITTCIHINGLFGSMFAMVIFINMCPSLLPRDSSPALTVVV